MTQGQLLLRIAGVTIILGALYMLVSGHLCLPTKGSGCRDVRGASAAAMFLAITAFASLFLILSTQPRAGKRARRMNVAWISFIVLYISAFFLSLNGP